MQKGDLGRIVFFIVVALLMFWGWAAYIRIVSDKWLLH
jgi:hypothetical protein